MLHKRVKKEGQSDNCEKMIMELVPFAGKKLER